MIKILQFWKCNYPKPSNLCDFYWSRKIKKLHKSRKLSKSGMATAFVRSWRNPKQLPRKRMRKIGGGRTLALRETTCSYSNSHLCFCAHILPLQTIPTRIYTRTPLVLFHFSSLLSYRRIRLTFNTALRFKILFDF